jgi:hypothetical protein
MVLAPIVELEPIAVHVPATWTRDGLPGLGRGSDTAGPSPAMWSAWPRDASHASMACIASIARALAFPC